MSSHINRKILQDVELTTPLSTPRDVFTCMDEPRPRSESEEPAQSFRIPLSSQVFRRARLQRLNRQKNLGITLIVILIVLLNLGCIYFNPIQLFLLQGTDEWNLKISQISFVFSILILAILVNFIWLLNICLKQRKSRLESESDLERDSIY